jgi:hypothetical protein
VRFLKATNLSAGSVKANPQVAHVCLFNDHEDGAQAQISTGWREGIDE